MNRYSSYKDSGVEWIEEIPNHWKKSKLKYVSEIITGNTPSKNIDENYINGRHLWIKPDGLNSFKPTNDCKERISDVGLSETRIVPPYSVLINGIGNIGKFGFSELKSTTNQQIHSVVFDSNVNKKFGLYLISNLTDEMNKHSEKVVISIYTKSKLSNLDIVLPPLHEQEQIVSYLDKKTAIIDTLITSKAQKINLLKENRTALINHVITKGLNPNVKLKDSGVEWIGEIPEHWEMKRLSNFGAFSKGRGIKKDEVIEKGLSCIRYGEIYTKYDRVVFETFSFISEETSKNSLFVSKGTVLFTGSGETISEIGKSIVWMGEQQIFVGGDIITLVLNNKLNPLFVSYLLNTNFVQYQKSLVGKGEIIVHIYAKNIKEIKTPLPPFSEQNQIVKYLDTHTQEIDELISLEEKKIVTLKEYRQALISEVVTGKIKVVN